MEDHENEVKRLLAEIESGSGRVFVGPMVHEDVARCKYPMAWIDTLTRYKELANEDEKSLCTRFYMDLCATVLTKRIITIDIHKIVGADDPEQTRQTSDTRIAHAIMFKMSVSRMLACICECVLKRSRSNNDFAVTTVESDKLYRRVETMLKEKFYKHSENGKYYTREKMDVTRTIHEMVDSWLLREALANAAVSMSGTVPDELRNWKTRLLSNDMSFFSVSHIYWLWLHLTAAGIQTHETERDFLSLLYALDLFIFCSECSSHFINHRRAFFTRRPYEVSVRTTYSAPLAVHGIHNVVNRETGKPLLSQTILADYERYWSRAGDAHEDIP